MTNPQDNNAPAIPIATTPPTTRELTGRATVSLVIFLSGKNLSVIHYCLDISNPARPCGRDMKQNRRWRLAAQRGSGGADYQSLSQTRKRELRERGLCSISSGVGRTGLRVRMRTRVMAP